MKNLACVLMFFYVAIGHAADWDLEKQKNGISVETRDVEGEKLKEFKGSMNVKASLNSLISLMEDFDRAPEWMHDNEGLTLDESIHERNRWLYLVNGAPWPLKTRDAYIHIRSTQDAQSKVITVEISSDPKRKAEHKKRVRIASMRGKWEFSPRADKTVDVTYAMFVDPGGSVPTSLANAVVVDNPYNTLKGMKRMLATGDYDNLNVSWVSEL